ncbi:MAG: hypothetical protein R3B47_19595 [Bacteroidia bacterium]
MVKLISSLFFLLSIGYSQALIDMPYEPDDKNPFGRLNPEAPDEVADFEPMIGHWHCKSLSRNADGSWQDTTDMEWRFKYVMNGTAVQDEVWREGNYAGSIRQFQADSAQWVVTYFSYPGVPYNPAVWHGKREENQIILFRDQAAPNGMEGFYRITFEHFGEKHFDWRGEWVSRDQSFVYPTWLIGCELKE